MHRAAMRAISLELGAIEFFEQPATTFEVACAGLRQGEIAGGAIDQPRFQMGFERGDGARDERIRYIELLSCAAKTQPRRVRRPPSIVTPTTRWRSS